MADADFGAGSPRASPAAAITHDDAPSKKKRKPQVDEIEVDLSLPEPPSKRAKRLLKKGKPLPAKTQSDDDADEGEPNDGLAVPARRERGAKGGDTKNNKKKQGDSAAGAAGGSGKRAEHGVWIGNLPFTLTRVELFRWLVESSGGAIAEANITRVNLPTSKDGGGRDRRRGGGGGGDGDGEEGAPPKPQNKGFAYVDFDGAAAAVAAMALTETELRGRKVLIKSATSFEGRPAKEGNSSTTTDGSGTAKNAAAADAGSSKIYVGNLPFQTDEDSLRAHFDKCGEVEWAKVATFEDSGKCKGYGWVRFRDAAAAAAAVRGFARVREAAETEADFASSDGEDEDEGEDGAESPPRQQQQKKRPNADRFKTRKWWVNRLRGRELKIELAEDDAARYKKRFGGGGGGGGGRGDARARGPASAKPGLRGGEKKKTATKKEPPPPAADADADADADARSPAERHRNSAAYGDAGAMSYRTGAVAASRGSKKITFD
ncbi:hypothetical protein GGS23DRAFT_614122 [Durotheca rogersii]|uniref:uncharacterized protein n=1 Tax=Durotheca rogersii TaxID=419775 RepID=UPI00221E3813|nr:uncharacterized protein GGS23DRAFT_614122 [Durotheca rogersii]KAI5860283.1 hypothetical protein GGS23DRAFT_614122 [Durotheca rogersii]